MLTTILGFIGSAAFRSITGELSAAYKAKLAATTSKEKQEADERIAFLEARKAVLVAESASTINQWMRVVLATPVAILLWKVFVFDKALGQWTQGRTDALSPELWWVIGAVIGFFFLSSSLDRWGKR